MKKLVLTYGDVNGIGPEVLIKALNLLTDTSELTADDVIIAGSKKVFEYYSTNFGLTLNRNYEIADVPICDNAFEIGHENALSGEHCFLCLKTACELVKNGVAKNITTGTVSKNVLNLAGHKFSGQTEILEHFLAKNDEKSEMLFVAKDFRLLLLTRHLPLAQVSKNISKKMLLEKFSRLENSLKNDFGIKKPKIGVLALNPHAGENGILGKEEIKTIIPAINEYAETGAKIFGPLVSDAEFAKLGAAYFNNKKLPYDCYAAMYHDQGLIPMKLLAGDYAINTTIGLSAIRTSPSHGTAFDIAGKNIAREQSMVEAIKLAIGLC